MFYPSRPTLIRFPEPGPWQARYEVGKVYHLQGALWLTEYENDLLAFPNGKYDDQVDVASYAGIEIADGGGYTSGKVYVC